MFYFLFNTQLSQIEPANLSTIDLPSNTKEALDYTNPGFLSLLKIRKDFHSMVYASIALSDIVKLKFPVQEPADKPVTVTVPAFSILLSFVPIVL